MEHGLRELSASASGPPPLTLDLRLSMQGEGAPPAADHALEIELRYEARAAIEGIVFGVEIVAADGARVYFFRSPVGANAWHLAPGLAPPSCVSPVSVLRPVPTRPT